MDMKYNQYSIRLVWMMRFHCIPELFPNRLILEGPIGADPVGIEHTISHKLELGALNHSAPWECLAGHSGMTRFNSNGSFNFSNEMLNWNSF